jgi:hypothetical protein
MVIFNNIYLKITLLSKLIFNPKNINIKKQRPYLKKK